MYNSGNPKLVLCDSLGGWVREGFGEEFRGEASQVGLCLIHVDVWQRPYSTVLQSNYPPIKINNFLKSDCQAEKRICPPQGLRVVLAGVVAGFGKASPKS